MEILQMYQGEAIPSEEEEKEEADPQGEASLWKERISSPTISTPEKSNQWDNSHQSSMETEKWRSRSSTA